MTVEIMTVDVNVPRLDNEAWLLIMITMMTMAVTKRTRTALGDVNSAGTVAAFSRL